MTFKIEHEETTMLCHRQMVMQGMYLVVKDIVMLIKIVCFSWKDNQKFKTSWMSQGNARVFVCYVL